MTKGGLQYSRPIDVHKHSKHSQVRLAISHLYEQLKATKCLGHRIHQNKIVKHLTAVVLDVYVAFKSDPCCYISYPRSVGSYSKKSRLGKLLFSYRQMIKVIDGLENLGLIENHIGFNDRVTMKRYQSRLRATTRLIDELEKFLITPSMVVHKPDHIIELRDPKTKEVLSYEDNYETQRLHKQLRLYNQFILHHKIHLSLQEKDVRKIIQAKKCKPIDFTRVQLTRIFNGDFTSGGRFYKGWWQQIPSELRQFITIDGQPTIELDYAGQHLMMLYSLAEDEYHWLIGDNDPYLLEEYQDVQRNLVKRVVLICINSHNRKQAITAIRKIINFKKYTICSSTENITALIDSILKKHHKISHLFFKGLGSYLQFQDSLIAEYVITHMQVRGQLVLPIHDSFIVSEGNIHRLLMIMIEAYRMEGMISIPDITFKQTSPCQSQETLNRFKEIFDMHKKVKNEEREMIMKLGSDH